MEELPTIDAEHGYGKHGPRRVLYLKNVLGDDRTSSTFFSHAARSSALFAARFLDLLLMLSEHAAHDSAGRGVEPLLLGASPRPQEDRPPNPTVNSS